MVITVTLNPALDKIILLKRLEKNKNNQIMETVYDIGGKATHISVVLSALYVENIATGIFAGKNGLRLQSLLEDKGVYCDFIWQGEGETRESFIIVPQEEGGSYMITQRGFSITRDTFKKMKSKLLDLIKEGDMVVFAGGPPPGISIEEYKELLQLVEKRKGKLILDIRGPYLEAGLQLMPYLIKPNEYEFQEITGMDTSKEKQCMLGIERLLKQGIKIVALSLGKRGSLIGTQEGFLRIIPPEVQEVNDTGCGDVFLGGALAMLAQHKNIEETFRFATAMGASKATHRESSKFSLNQTQRFLEQVKIEFL